MRWLLWRAFERDPLFRYLFRSRWYAGRVVPLLFGAQARDALRHGCIDVAVPHRRPLAAAIWLAVDPDRQGQGVGGRVLAFGLRRADEAGVACGLETSNERTIALYRRFGFEVQEETRPFTSGPPTWSMWRPASSPILLPATPAGNSDSAGDRDSAPATEPAPGSVASGAGSSSPRGIRRRAVLVAAGAGAAGFAVGWLVRPADVGRLPGEDVGALYHRASTPGFADALGALVSYALIETGHIGQNVYLAAEAAGLGACAVGAFLDDAVNRLLEIAGVDEAALMLLPVGPR